MRGSKGPAYNELRARVLADAGYQCQIGLEGVCSGTATQLDHIRALADGGALLDPANVRAACRECNQKLGAHVGSRRAGTYHGRWSRVW